MKTEAFKDMKAFIEEEIYSKLGDSEKKMMKVASLFDRPFEADALFVEEDLDFDTLVQLKKKSLMRMVADGRYEAHEVIRSFFAEIATPEERRKYSGKIAPYLLDMGSRARLGYRNDVAIGLYSNALGLEVDERSRLKALEGLGDIYLLVGDSEKAKGNYRKALELVKEKEDSARVERKLGRAHHEAGDVEDAFKLYENAYGFVEDKESLEAGKCKLALAQILHRRTECEESCKKADEALTIFERFPGEENDKAKVHSLLGLNYIYGDKQDLRKAEDHLLTSLDLRIKAHNLDGEATTRKSLAIAYIYLGDGEKALHHLEEGLKLAKETRSFHTMVLLRFTTGCAYYELLGEFDKGEDQFKKALTIVRESGDEHGEAICHQHFSRIHRYRGELDKALEHSAKSLELAEKIENRFLQLSSHVERAKEFLAKGELSDAMLSCMAARELAEKLGDNFHHVYCVKVEGAILREQKEWERSQESFEKALGMLEEMKQEYLLAMVCYDYALLWKARGEKKKAKEYGDRAVKLLKEQNVQWLVKRVEDDLKYSANE